MLTYAAIRSLQLSETHRCSNVNWRSLKSAHTETFGRLFRPEPGAYAARFGKR